jgi:hypothetical protein
VKIILTCLVCALCLGVLVRLDVTMLSGQAQAFFQETVAPVLHVDTTGSKLRNLFVPVLADSEVDTTGNRWDKVAVSMRRLQKLWCNRFPSQRVLHIRWNS